MATKLVRDYAHSRAGDKGDICNVSVIAYDKEGYEIVKEALTCSAVKAYFRGRVKGEVERYELPQLNALNFVLHNSLNGGVTRSLAIDIHGKTFSSALLNFPVTRVWPHNR